MRSVTLGEMPASFEQLLEELRHTHQMELAELKAEADRLLVEKKTWTATTERSRSQKAAREADDDEESDTTLPDPNLFSSEKVVPLETFLEAEEFPRSPSEGEAEILDSMAVSAPFENKIDIQEEIENAKPWMDEEGIKHYKLKGESLQDAGLSLESPDPLPRDASLLAHALESDRYELLVGATVLASVGIMAADYQYAGYSVGQAIEFQGMHELPWGDPNPEWIAVVSMCLDIIFGVDVVVRVAVLRCRFFRLFVNWIDLFVAILSVSASFIAGLDEGFNVWALRMLRLAKVARALRLMRMRRALESLSLLLRCVQSSLQVLFWSLGLLGVIQCIAGMVIGQLLMPYMRNESIDVVRRSEVYKYFGTFNRTLLTMFEVLFANWAIPARICIENVSEGFIYIFIFYRCLVGFAVLNVVSAVFVQQTMKVAQADQEYVLNQKQKQVEAYAGKLKRFFMTLDASGDGLVSWDEFSVLLSDPQLQLWMSTLDLETQDLVSLFQMIDDGDGEISVEEFIDGATRLRGMARSLDVAQVMTSIKKLELKLEDLKKTLRRRGRDSSHSPTRIHSVHSTVSNASRASNRSTARLRDSPNELC